MATSKTAIFLVVTAFIFIPTLHAADAGNAKSQAQLTEQEKSKLAEQERFEAELSALFEKTKKQKPVKRQGEFAEADSIPLNVLVERINEDGTKEGACVEDFETAKKFFAARRKKAEQAEEVKP